MSCGFTSLRWLLGVCLVAASASAQSDADPKAVPANPTFGAVRIAADRVARQWGDGAKLFRADLAAAYSASVPSYGIIRLIYCRPGDSRSGLEVTYDRGVDATHVRTADYPLGLAGPIVPAPEKFLEPGDAIRRLWELEPCVPTSRVFVQLLKVGVERPLVVDQERYGAGQRSSFPHPFLLEHFPADVADDEADAPRDRFVWRMLALRDADAPMGKPYGVFIYIDAQTGRPLSRRGPAITGADLTWLNVCQGSPVPVFDFAALPANADVPVDGTIYSPETFDLLAIRQCAESLALGLREMIALGASDDAFDSAADKVARWDARIPAMQARAQRAGLAGLESAVERSPRDAASRARLARRYVDEVVAEKAAALRPCPPILRLDASPTIIGNGPVTALDLGRNLWVYHFADFMIGNYPKVANLQPAPSRYGQAAQAAIADALALDAEQPIAWAERARLQRTSTLTMAAQYEACARAMKLNPRSAVPRLLFATFPAEWNENNSMLATQLEQSRVWYTSSVTFHDRDTSSGPVRETVSRIYRHEQPPSPEQLARAQQLKGQAQQMQVWAARLRDEALKLAPRDPTIYFTVARVIIDDRNLRDRLACDGLLADPSHSGLYGLRPWIYDFLPNGRPVNLAVTDATQTFGGPVDAARCIALSVRSSKNDAFTSYCAALQAVRLDPAGPRPHLALAAALARMSGYQLNGVELMPDALEQAQLEFAVAERLAAHDLARGAADLPANTLNAIVQEARANRAQCIRATGRNP